MTTSVTPGRPYRWSTLLGLYEFRHLRKDLLTGYRRTLLAGGQEAFVATPEKALLDLLYLEPDADTEEYLNELRLQHLDTLDLGELHRLAEQRSWSMSRYEALTERQKVSPAAGISVAGLIGVGPEAI